MDKKQKNIRQQVSSNELLIQREKKMKVQMLYWTLHVYYMSYIMHLTHHHGEDCNKIKKHMALKGLKNLETEQ